MNKRPLTISTKTMQGRAILIAAVVFALVFLWFGVRWQLGSMLSELTVPEQENAAEIAALSMDLSPGNPNAYWLSATKQAEVFSEESLNRSVELLEQAVRLSPNDYRLWVELGRGYEQAEKFDQAETALQQAIALAPEYSFPHWQMGNYLLRRGRPDEAFDEFRKTTEKSVIYREQVFSLAWSYFEGDASKVESLAADTPEVWVYLADFFSKRNAGRDAVRVWNKLSPEQKAEHNELAKVIARQLYVARMHRDALAFARETGIDKESEHEKITNAGFESFIGGLDDTLFGWRLFRSDPKLDVSIDSSVKAEGNRSLKVNFRLYDKRELYDISQIITAEPGKRYRIDFKVRTENLRSGAMPLFTIAGGKAGTHLGASQPISAGTTGWQDSYIEFLMPEDEESFELRMVREYCEESCPMSGIFWIDDLRLTRLD